MPDPSDPSPPNIPPPNIPPPSVPPPAPPPPEPPPASSAPPPPAYEAPPPPSSGGMFSAAGLPTSVAYGQGRVSASDDKTFCVLIHALSIIAGFLAPLLFWLIKKDDSPAVDAHGKESLNFQLNIIGWFVISFILAMVTCGFLGFLPLLVWLYSVVMCIVAAFKAADGHLFRYPLTWRLIK